MFLYFLQDPCLSIMLRQEESAFINVISTMQTSQALLKELRTALSTRRKRKTVVSAGSRSTTLSGGPKATQRPPTSNAGKRKANGLVDPGDSTEPANSRPALALGPRPCPRLLLSWAKKLL